MLRAARTPRALGLLALAVVLAAAAVQLGRWQWQVAHDEARADAVRAIQERPVRPLGEVIQPHAAFPDDGSGQRVAVTGRYAKGDQLLISNRLLDGRRGRWVVDRLVVTGSGSNLPVVRGWIPDGAATPAPPTGEVALVGSLAPGEAPAEAGPDGTVTTIDLTRLVNEWPGDLYNAFAFAVTEGDAPPAGVSAVPPPLPDTSFNLRNAAYALQWWAFGLFALWMWWRVLRQDAERAAAGPAPSDPSDGGAPDLHPGPTPTHPDLVPEETR